MFIPTLAFAFDLAHFGIQIRSHLSGYRIVLETIIMGLLILPGTDKLSGWVTPR